MKAKQTLRKLLNYSFLNLIIPIRLKVVVLKIFLHFIVIPRSILIFLHFTPSQNCITKLIEQVFVFISLIMYLMVREGCLKQYTMMIRQDLITSRNALKV